MNANPPPSLFDQLSSEQKAAASKMRIEDRGIIWWAVGTGKTRIALCWICYLSPQPRPLIVCSPGAFRQWEDEMELLKVDKYIIPSYLSYGMLSQKRVEIDYNRFNCVIVDELWLYKNANSKRSRRVREITNRYPSIGLSGSMMTARNIEDLYGQARAIGIDGKIARNITDFRSRYCIASQNYAGFIERYPKHGAVKQIQTALYHNIHLYFPKETREIRNIPVNIEPTNKQAQLRKELTYAYYYESKSEMEANNFRIEIKGAAALLVKLQQISDGFLHDGEGHYLHVESSKQARLRALCAELLDAGERILIWVAFRKSAILLSEILPEKTLLLSGSDEFDYEQWKKGKANICVATVGSGASINDFKDVRYSIFYSTRFSHLQMQQAKGRTNRKSSAHQCCYYYYLQTIGFPDRDVYEMLDASRSAEEYVISVTNKILADTVK